MPIDLAAIKARLQSFDKRDAKSAKTKTFIWKPVKGKQTVRIVPYQHQPENPFVELKFHYGLNNKNYLSPASFNQPDPVVELSEHLKKSGDKDQWRMGRNLEPKLRTYVPVVVRGEEEKGVRFWGFGQTVYKQLLGIMSEPDYGDITDLNNGFDIQVEFKDAAETGKNFPDTQILVKPRTRPVIESNNPNVKSLMELITKKQPNIMEVYEVATYAELKGALEAYLKKADGDDTTTETTPNDSAAPTTTQVQEEVQEPVATETEPEQAEAAAVVTPPTPTVVQPAQTVKPKAPVTPAKSPSAAAAKANVNEFANAFDNLFNS